MPQRTPRVLWGDDWVDITEPAADIIMNRIQAGNCTDIDATVAGDGMMQKESDINKDSLTAQ